MERIPREFRKHSGVLVPFDKGKIIASVQKALTVEGQSDRALAEDVAQVVAVYLDRELEGVPPTSDRTREAVEQTLVGLGRGKAALAYSRYDRPQRDAEELMEYPQPDVVDDGGRWVQTSQGTLEPWDRGRIVDALVRESKLDPSVARVVATEVEAQITRAGLTTATASLIREMVDATLVKFGLEEYRRLHVRIGQSLFDTEQVVIGAASPEGEISPLQSTLRLGAEIKREFAFTRVYSAEVVRACMSGLIGLDPADGIDLFEEVFLQAALLYGRAPGWDRVMPLSQPMARIPVVTADAIRCCRSRIHWFGMESLRETGESDPNSPEIEKGISTVFRELRLVQEASREVPITFHFDLGCEQTDEEFKRAVQWGVAGLWNAGQDSPARPPITTAIHLRDVEFLSEKNWQLLAEGLNSAGIGAICLETPGSTTLPGLRSLQPELSAEDRADIENPGRASCAIMQTARINVPEVVRRRNRRERGLFDPLFQAVELSVQAHLEKLGFWDRMVSLRNEGALSRLVRDDAAEAILRRSRWAFRVVLEGVSEAVRLSFGEKAPDSDKEIEWIRELLQEVGDFLKEVASRNGISVHLVLEEETTKAILFPEDDSGTVPDSRSRWGLPCDVPLPLMAEIQCEVDGEYLRKFFHGLSKGAGNPLWITFGIAERDCPSCGRMVPSALKICPRCEAELPSQ